jgi:hypothetical protein
MKPYALRFARFERIEDCLRQGWMPLIQNAAHHHQHYGIELAWLCACPVPGGFKHSVNHRVPSNPNQVSAENERAEHRA